MSFPNIADNTINAIPRTLTIPREYITLRSTATSHSNDKSNLGSEALIIAPHLSTEFVALTSLIPSENKKEVKLTKSDLKREEAIRHAERIEGTGVKARDQYYRLERVEKSRTCCAVM